MGWGEGLWPHNRVFHIPVDVFSSLLRVFPYISVFFCVSCIFLYVFGYLLRIFFGAGIFPTVLSLSCSQAV